MKGKKEKLTAIEPKEHGLVSLVYRINILSAACMQLFFLFWEFNELFWGRNSRLFTMQMKVLCTNMKIWLSHLGEGLIIARNVSFPDLSRWQFDLYQLVNLIKTYFHVSLSHRRSTTVSLQTRNLSSAPNIGTSLNYIHLHILFLVMFVISFWLLTWKKVVVFFY